MLTSSAMLTSSSTTRTCSGEPSARVSDGAWFVTGMLTASPENIAGTLGVGCEVPVNGGAVVAVPGGKGSAGDLRADAELHAAALVDLGVEHLVVEGRGSGLLEEHTGAVLLEHLVTRLGRLGGHHVQGGRVRSVLADAEPGSALVGTWVDALVDDGLHDD